MLTLARIRREHYARGVGVSILRRFSALREGLRRGRSSRPYRGPKLVFEPVRGSPACVLSPYMLFFMIGYDLRSKKKKNEA